MGLELEIFDEGICWLFVVFWGFFKLRVGVIRFWVVVVVIVFLFVIIFVVGILNNEVEVEVVVVEEIVVLFDKRI